jgi:hypothetical protein
VQCHGVFPADPPAVMLHRMPVTAVRGLFASVGIDYEIGCEDGEKDQNPREDYIKSGPGGS